MLINRTSRQGKVVVFMALALPVVIGYTAVALEGGLLMDNKRRAQAVADSAALSAATSLYENYPRNNGLDPNGQARLAALSSASQQQFTNDGTTSIVTVNIPPLTGPKAGRRGHVEVIIQYMQPRHFSRIFPNATDDLRVTVRSVAQGRWEAFPAGIMALDMSVSEAVKAGGGGQILVEDADVIVNSNNAQAIGTNGTGTTLTVTGNGIIHDAGGIKDNSNIVGPLLLNQEPLPDPLRYLPYPSKPTTSINANTLGMQGNSAAAKPYLQALGISPSDYKNYKVYVLEPGRYTQMPNFNNNDVVILKQASANSNGGVYYLDGTGFTSTGATVVMDPTGGTTGGVMFYNDPGNGLANTFSMTGGKVRLSPVTSGPYSGILFFQRRDANEPVNITGQGNMKLDGTFYAAGAALKVAGSDLTGFDVLGAQYISRTFEAMGNGIMNLKWSNNSARIRKIGLVE